nr:unnamed protein product [Haemonchus contortus]
MDKSEPGEDLTTGGIGPQYETLRNGVDAERNQASIVDKDDCEKEMPTEDASFMKDEGGKQLKTRDAPVMGKDDCGEKLHTEDECLLDEEQPAAETVDQSQLWTAHDDIALVTGVTHVGPADVRTGGVQGGEKENA